MASLHGGASFIRSSVGRIEASNSDQKRVVIVLFNTFHGIGSSLGEEICSKVGIPDKRRDN